MPSENPSPEVAKYFKNKGVRPSYSWKDVFEQEHAYNFTVAKATSVDVLTSIKDNIQKAIDEGLSYKDFQKQAEPRLRELGWWCKKKMIDPRTGEDKLVELGSNRRLKTIFDTNIRIANASGKWERIERTKKLLPYLQYSLGAVKTEHREEHEGYEGKVLSVDDEFWSTHYPPNGWGCKCWVRQISKSEAQELGISESPLRPYTEVKNERTGKMERQYKGVSLGFASNAGKERGKTLSDFFNDKIEKIDTNMARTVIKDAVQSDAFKKHYLVEKENRDGLYLPVGIITKNSVKKQLGINKNTSVRFSGYTAGKGALKHPDIKQADYLLVQDILDNENLIDDKVKNHWVGYKEVGTKYIKTAIKKTSKGEIYLQTLHKADNIKK